MNERNIKLEIEVGSYNLENDKPPNVLEVMPTGEQTLITSAWMTKKEEWEGLINELKNVAVINETYRMNLIIDISEWQGEHVKKLSFMLFSKKELIKKVFESQEDRPAEILMNNDQLTLKNIKATLNSEMVTAYITLAISMCEMAMTLKRANAAQKVVNNDRYSFRTWLLRMGMIGDDYKNTRKCLLKKLEGNAAFKNVK